MADVYVNSGATGGTYDGTAKATAYQTLAAALSAAPAGANVWVHKAHVENAAAVMTLGAANGTSNAARLNIASVDFGGSTPPVAADLVPGAVVGTNGAYAITMTGTFESRGVTYSAFTINLGTTGAAVDAIFDPSTVLKLAVAGSASGTINLGASVTGLIHRIDLNGAQIASVCTASGTQNLCTVYNTMFNWRAAPGAGANLALPTATTTTFSLFLVKGVAAMLLEGVDLSGATGLGAANRYVFGAPTVGFRADLKDCKLPTSYGGLLNGSLVTGSRVRLIRSGGAAGSYGQQIYVVEGSVVDELSVILSGGLSDGVTPKSRKFAAAGASAASPLVDATGTIWNGQTGSAITVSMEVLAPTGATNGDLWLEVEGLVDPSDPLGGFASSGRATPLTAATALSASTAIWSNVPNGYSAYKLAAVMTPQQAGPLTLRVKAASAGPFYVDGKPTVSGASAPVSRSFAGPEGTLIHETQATVTNTVTNTVTQFVPVSGRRSFR